MPKKQPDQRRFGFTFLDVLAPKEDIFKQNGRCFVVVDRFQRNCESWDFSEAPEKTPHSQVITLVCREATNREKIDLLKKELDEKEL